MPRMRPFCFLCTSVLIGLIHTGAAHAAPDTARPSLATRSEPEAPWLRLAVSVDLLAVAFDEYRGIVTYGIGRYLGVRVEGAWRRDEVHRIGVGAGLELWPLGRGVDGWLILASAGGAFDPTRPGGLVRAGAEVGYRWVWRGVALGALIGVDGRWWRDRAEASTTQIVPAGELTVGYAF